ncbi:MAG: winged helix-turn-helix domain-containing protein [Burkholderiales bacterium]
MFWERRRGIFEKSELRILTSRQLNLLGLLSENRLLRFREKNGTGEDRPWWPNVVQWARQDLKGKGLLSWSRHGYWRLNDEGKETYENLTRLWNESGLPFEKFVERFVEDKE